MKGDHVGFWLWFVTLIVGFAFVIFIPPPTSPAWGDDPTSAADCPCGESCDCDSCGCAALQKQIDGQDAEIKQLQGIASELDGGFRESFDSYKLYVSEMGKSLVSLNKELRETTAENERLQRENMRLEQRQCQLESKIEAAATAAVNASDGGLQQ